MLAGVSYCPFCGDDLEMQQLSDDEPIADVTQACPTCDRTFAGIVVFYPDGSFDLVAVLDAFDTTIADRKLPNPCQCGAEPVVGRVRVSSGAETYCRSCCPDHYDAVFE